MYITVKHPYSKVLAQLRGKDEYFVMARFRDSDNIWKKEIYQITDKNMFRFLEGLRKVGGNICYGGKLYRSILESEANMILFSVQ